MTTGGGLVTIIAFAVAGLGWAAALYEKRRIEAYKAARDARAAK